MMMMICGRLHDPY